MYQKNLNFDIFLHENFHFLPSYLTARLAKTTAHRMLFLVSMDSQRSKKFDGSEFQSPPRIGLNNGNSSIQNGGMYDENGLI